MSELYFKVKELYEKQGGPIKEALTKLTWPYGPRRSDGTISIIDPHAVAKEINGFFLEDKKVENPDQEGRFQGIQEGRSGADLCLAPG